jgi:hypothetical protein
MDLIGTNSSISLTQPITFGKRHHSPPYNVFYDSLWELHPNDIFSQGSQVGVPKLELLLSQILDVRIFFKSSMFGTRKGIIL